MTNYLKMSSKNQIKKIVFERVNCVSFGETSTYKKIARESGKINPRTIGKILNSNNKLICVPCHRIIYSNGKLGGYKLGTNLKKFILEWEKKIIS